jgi:hypothetical protein
MKHLPEIIIGGYPNSGTSFLCNLVVQLGKSPGSPHNLKGADAHNRWGYFEHLPIRKLVWEAGGWRQFVPERQGFLPDEPLVFDNSAHSGYPYRIRMLAQQDGVQVYKDNSLALVFRLFPRTSKYIAISRKVEAIYESPKKSGGDGYQCSLEELYASHRKYYQLVNMMAKEVDCLTIQYESFKTNFDDVLQLICDHIEVKLTDERYAACRDVFRPRSSSRWTVAPIINRLLRKGKRALSKRLSHR